MNHSDTHPAPVVRSVAPFLVIGAALLAGIALLVSHPIGTGDTYLHLAAGQWILEHGTIPKQNLFMYTAPDHSWVDHTWLPQVIFVLIHRAFGPVGLQVYAVALYAAAFGLILWLWRRLGVGAHLAVLPFLLGILLPIGRYAPRPELFTDVFLAITLTLVLTWRASSHRGIWALPPLFVLWVNCHGGVMAGLLFLWVFLAGEGLQAAIAAKRPAAWLPALPFERWRMLAVVVAAASVAVVINPYGPGWVRSVSPSHIRFMASYIDEWRPLLRGGLQTGAALPVILVFMAAACATFLSSRRFHLSNLAVVIVFIASAFTSQRNIVICALVLLAIMGSNLSQGTWPALAGRWTTSPKVTRRLLAAVGALLWLAIVVFAWGDPALRWLGSQRHLGFGIEANALPVRAERFWRTNDLPPRLFNTIDDGAYIAWKRPQGRPVFVDGLNAFGWPVVREYREIVTLGPSAEVLIRRWQINTFLLPQPDLARRSAGQRDIYSFLAESPQWRLVFWDGVSVIYLRDAPEHRTLIEQYGYRYLDPGNPRSLAYSEHPEEAAGELGRATAASPDAPYLRVLAGFTYLGLEMPDQAASEFLAALRLAPDYADAYRGLGLLYLWADRIGEAETMFRQAARLAPGDPAPHGGLAAVAQARGNAAGALAEWKKVVRRAPTSPRDRANLALAYEAAGEPKRAVRTWRQVLELNPDPETADRARASIARLTAASRP